MTVDTARIFDEIGKYSNSLAKDNTQLAKIGSSFFVVGCIAHFFMSSMKNRPQLYRYCSSLAFIVTGLISFCKTLPHSAYQQLLTTLCTVCFGIVNAFTEGNGFDTIPFARDHQFSNTTDSAIVHTADRSPVEKSAKIAPATNPALDRVDGRTDARRKANQFSLFTLLKKAIFWAKASLYAGFTMVPMINLNNLNLREATKGGFFGLFGGKTPEFWSQHLTKTNYLGVCLVLASFIFMTSRSHIKRWLVDRNMFTAYWAPFLFSMGLFCTAFRGSAKSDIIPSWISPLVSFCNVVIDLMGKKAVEPSKRASLRSSPGDSSIAQQSLNSLRLLLPAVH